MSHCLFICKGDRDTRHHRKTSPVRLPFNVLDISSSILLAISLWKKRMTGSDIPVSVFMAYQSSTGYSWICPIGPSQICDLNSTENPVSIYLYRKHPAIGTTVVWLGSIVTSDWRESTKFCTAVDHCSRDEHPARQAQKTRSKKYFFIYAVTKFKDKILQMFQDFFLNLLKNFFAYIRSICRRQYWPTSVRSLYSGKSFRYRISRYSMEMDMFFLHHQHLIIHLIKPKACSQCLLHIFDNIGKFCHFFRSNICKIFYMSLGYNNTVP